jgi:PleD family two-component response regulator
LLVLPGSNLVGGKIAAERLRKTIEELSMPGPGGQFKVTSSFGVASVRPRLRWHHERTDWTGGYSAPRRQTRRT